VGRRGRRVGVGSTIEDEWRAIGAINAENYRSDTAPRVGIISHAIVFQAGRILVQNPGTATLWFEPVARFGGLLGCKIACRTRERVELAVEDI
jgi:hypothetical protein